MKSNTWVAPIRTGLDGGMNRVFLSQVGGSLPPARVPNSLPPQPAPPAFALDNSGSSPTLATRLFSGVFGGKPDAATQVASTDATTQERAGGPELPRKSQSCSCATPWALRAPSQRRTSRGLNRRSRKSNRPRKQSRRRLPRPLLQSPHRRKKPTRRRRTAAAHNRRSRAATSQPLGRTPVIRSQRLQSEGRAGPSDDELPIIDICRGSV